MKLIKREIQEAIQRCFFKGKVIIIYGARQVGKTTLVRQIQANYPDSLYLNCDEPDIRNALTDVTSTQIKSLIGEKKVIFIDEAQRVKNIGLTLKIMADNFKNIQVVATGSSAFELSNRIIEPLTGRKYEFHLYPFSLKELLQLYSRLELRRVIEKRIILGMYPEVTFLSDTEAKDLLREIARSYLYKDALVYQQIKNPDVLEKLLQLLALQIGREVSYNELASNLGVDKKTVSSYIQILEKAFVIFRIKPFSKNLRKEITKLRKIYFIDMGIRNALINNLNPFYLRQDKGELWENFLISERIKMNMNLQRTINTYFWRTHQKEEVDYLEEYQDKIEGFEFKLQEARFRIPKSFRDNYPDIKVNLVTKENFEEFVFQT